VSGTDRFLGKPLAPDAVDSYLAVHADSSVTIFVGKADIATGGRVAMASSWARCAMSRWGASR
jgi:hypothetical protein